MNELEQQVEDLPRRLVPRVLIVHGKYQGPNLWRCWWPAGYLATRGFVVEFCSYDRFDEQHGLLKSGRYNIVVTPRIAFASERAYQMWRDVIHGLGLVWLYDSDDDLWSPEFPERQVHVFEGMPEGNLTWKEYETERLQRIYVLKRVDAVTASTQHLALTAGKFTSAPVYILPNLINAEAFEAQVASQPRILPPLTVGWSGTRRQDDDLQTVAQAWHIVAERFPDVKFVVQGYQAPVLCEAVPIERLVLLRGVPTNEYPAILRNIDIACCSVSDDPWNLNKSGIKYLEATLAGSACVVSEALYGRYVANGETAYRAATVEDWVGAISTLVTNDTIRRQMQRNAREVVLREHSFQSRWPIWVLAWSKTLDARNKINANAPDTRTESATPVVISVGTAGARDRA